MECEDTAGEEGAAKAFVILFLPSHSFPQKPGQPSAAGGFHYLCLYSFMEMRKALRTRGSRAKQIGVLHPWEQRWMQRCTNPKSLMGSWFERKSRNHLATFYRSSLTSICALSRLPCACVTCTDTNGSFIGMFERHWCQREFFLLTLMSFKSGTVIARICQSD